MVGEADRERDKRRFVQRERPDEPDPQESDEVEWRSPLVEPFAELTRALLSADSVGGVLEEIVSATKRVIPGADLVSITLRDPNGRFYTPLETDPLASRIDELQYQTGEGPCVDAARPDGPAMSVCQNVAAEPRWPRFGPAAAALGIGAVLGTALVPDARPPRQSGALNIFSRRVDGLDEADHTAALLLATHASLALAHTHAVTMHELKIVNLHKALDSRDVIGQAKGILMARRGISADEAFDLLRRTSQDLNTRLVEIARTVTARHGELDLDVARD
jgi:ANTAR domain/GAF domain